MRIALLNSADVAGGAESVARLLRDGLGRCGHQTSLWVGRSNAEGVANTFVLPRSSEQAVKAQRYARRGFFGLGHDASFEFCHSDELASCDLVHLHNLHGHYFSIDALQPLARRLPLVWTLHDHFAITGGCAFPVDCDRWLTQCGSCPQLGNYPIVSPFDRTRRMQSIKRSVFRDLPVTIVTPSQHLGNAVKKSGVFAKANYVDIPYGVDTEVFHPHRELARRDLGLSEDQPVVLLAAQGLDDPRKGTDHAISALQRLTSVKVTVLLLGNGDAGAMAKRIPHHDVRPQGYQADPSAIARCYAAADVFVFTSLAENYPCSVQEAMACGTVVLAFEIPGVDEQIKDQHTGFLVPSGDTGALGHRLSQLLASRITLESVGIAARKHATTHWNLDRFLTRHEMLYQRIVQTAPKAERDAFAVPV